MSDLSVTFDNARKLPSGETLEILRQNYFIEASMKGSDDTSIGGINVNTSGRHDLGNVSSDKEKKAREDMAFMALLDDMRQRLEDLEASMTRLRKSLELKYDRDIVGGMAATFLTPEELEGLETDQQKMQALAEKFLNPDGSIKDEYKHLEEAQYVRDWNEAEKLRPIVKKYEGRQTLEPDERQEVVAVAQSVGLSGAENMLAQSQNQNVKTTIEKVISEDHQNHAHHDSGTSGFNFGK